MTKRLSRRDVKGIDEAEQGGERKHMPHLYTIGECEGGQDKGQEHRCCLRGDEDAMAIMPVSYSATDSRKQKNRKLSREGDESEQDRRTRQPIDEPGLCYRLHPGARERNELPAKEELEIPVPQRPEDQCKFGPGWGGLPTNSCFLPWIWIATHI